MKGTIKRLCAVAAALCMAMSLMAVPAFAADGDEDKTTTLWCFIPVSTAPSQKATPPV